MTDRASVRSLVLPVLLLGLAVTASLGAGTLQSWRQRQALAAALGQQADAVTEGDRLRQQLEGLLSGATALANGGNVAARAALDGLAKQGVTYNPPSPAGR